MLFRNVLLGIDGSPSAAQALGRAIEIARASGGRIGLLGVVPTLSAWIAMPPFALPISRAQLAADLEEDTQRHVARRRGAGTAELHVALARDGAGPHLRHCLKAAAAGELKIEPRRGAARDARPDVDDVSEMSFPASDPPATWTWDPPGPFVANSR